MACLLCGADRATRRIIDPAAGAVAAAICEACAEYLLVDRGSPTCELCGELGAFDLARLDVPLPDAGSLDVDEDLDVVERDVLCEEHLDDLQADAGDL